ncbi:hypothetical protein PoB_000492900 [Plakobranchus ocellatus]|uniref:Uncharacterized protein n=1 Tax=Plakobranchus ocellatus TaxID=259542 RepID=A0AAV3Y846_9GAST|nr:hypothetical protein PoB_000492900 [Plakobranchus ocellatus]
MTKEERINKKCQEIEQKFNKLSKAFFKGTATTGRQLIMRAALVEVGKAVENPNFFTNRGSLQQSGAPGILLHAANGLAPAWGGHRVNRHGWVVKLASSFSLPEHTDPAVAIHPMTAPVSHTPVLLNLARIAKRIAVSIDRLNSCKLKFATCKCNSPDHRNIPIKISGCIKSKDGTMLMEKKEVLNRC